jgi:hypothetical protein
MQKTPSKEWQGSQHDSAAESEKTVLAQDEKIVVTQAPAKPVVEEAPNGGYGWVCVVAGTKNRRNATKTSQANT